MWILAIMMNTTIIQQPPALLLHLRVVLNVCPVPRSYSFGAQLLCAYAIFIPLWKKEDEKHCCFLSTSILAILSFGWWLNVFSVLSFTMSACVEGLLQNESFAYAGRSLTHTRLLAAHGLKTAHTLPSRGGPLSASLHQHTFLFTLCAVFINALAVIN